MDTVAAEGQKGDSRSGPQEKMEMVRAPGNESGPPEAESVDSSQATTLVEQLTRLVPESP